MTEKYTFLLRRDDIQKQFVLILALLSLLNGCGGGPEGGAESATITRQVQAIHLLKTLIPQPTQRAIPILHSVAQSFLCSHLFCFAV